MQLYMAVAAALGIAGLLAFPGAMGFQMRMIRLKFAELVLLLAMAAIGIIGYGDKFSPTNNPPSGLNQPMMMIPNPQQAVPAVTETDVARGFSVVSVGTNEVFDFAMPADATRVRKWWLRGGSNDKAFVPGGIALIRGEILDKLPRPSARYCPLKATSLLVAGQSEFWHLQTASNSTVYTWKDAYLWRNISLPFSMQAEIFGNGDFEYRYDLSRIADMSALTNVVIGAQFGTNELGDVSHLLDGTNILSSVRFHRLSEFDWDDDGLANEVDPAPYASNGDCFGTGEGWLAANPAVVSATNANPGAYYALQFAVMENGTQVQVTCDGPSDLGDMVIVANSNQVCRVPLLVGAEYEVASSSQLADVFLSDTYAVVSAEGASSAVSPAWSRFRVSYPLDFSVSESADGICAVSSAPAIPGMEIAALLGGCCSNQIYGLTFAGGCSGACGCRSALHDMLATLSWSGYSRSFGFGRWCPCIYEGESEGQFPRLELEAPQTLFTNDDGGAELSDIVPVTAGLVSRGTTNSTLTLSFTGGDMGVSIWETSNGTSRVDLPVEWDVAQCPGKTFYAEAGAVFPRGGNGFRLEWSDGGGGTPLSTNTSLAAYCPVVNVVNSSIYDSGDLCNPSGIVVGTNACFAVGFKMVQPPASEIEWSVVEGSARFVGTGFGNRVRVASDVPNQRVTLRAQVADCRSRPIEISAHVVTQEVVKLTVWIVGNKDGTYYASDTATVSNMIAGVNKIYEQIGVSFHIDTITYTNNEDWLDISVNDVCNRTIRRSLVNLTQNSDGLELYYINHIAKGVNANHDRYGIVLSTNATSKSLAHEIGHSFGCADVYPVRRVGAPAALPEPMVSKEHLPEDWSNGTNCRYYMPNLVQEAAIRRLLMCGFDYPDAKDLSSGAIYGYGKGSAEAGLVDIGFFNSSGRALIILHW